VRQDAATPRDGKRPDTIGKPGGQRPPGHPPCPQQRRPVPVTIRNSCPVSNVSPAGQRKPQTSRRRLDNLPLAMVSARNGRDETMGRDDGMTYPAPRDGRKVIPTTNAPHHPQKGTLGGSNRMLSARDVAAILAVPERTVRDKWREWGLQAYKIGKHLRWRERDVYAWIDRQAA
jgi:excisionase family DNA binding protein